MRTVSAACAMADAPSTVAAVMIARMWRRGIFIVTFPFCFFLIGLVFDRSGGVATSQSFRRGELNELHGRHEMFRERRDRGIGVALERGMHDCRVFGLDVAGFFAVAPDREPSIPLALLMEHIAKPEQPLRAAGVHQRAVEDAMPYHPFLIVMGRIVGIGVGNGAERRERFFYRGKPGRVATLDRTAQRQSLDIHAGLRYVPEIGRRNRADAKTAL